MRVTSPITRLVSISPMAIVNAVSGTGTHDWTWDVVNSWIDNSTGGLYNISIALIDRVVITAFRFTGQFLAGGVCIIGLRNRNHADAGSTAMAGGSLTTTMEEFSSTSIMGSSIDNDSRHYYIDIDTRFTAAEVRIRGIQIDYTIQRSKSY